MDQPTDSPVAIPPQPPPPEEAPPKPVDRRGALDRVLDAIHHVMDSVGEDVDLSKLTDEQKKTLRGAARYAHDHLLFHMDEKRKSETAAAAVIGGCFATFSGIVIGHVLTKPSEPYRAGVLRDVFAQLSPEHKAMGLSALKYAMEGISQWVARQEDPPAPTPEDPPVVTPPPAT